MTDFVHHPDTHRLGKTAPKEPHIMVHEFVDFERLQVQVPVNVINSVNQGTALAMYLNDREGDCTIAGVANTLRVNSGGKVQLPDSAVQTGYIAVTAEENNGQGYDPNTGANDNGCNEIDVLDYWVRTGIGGNFLKGHAGVDMSNADQVKAGAYLFGSIYPGWALSVDQQRQPIWQPGQSPLGSWGGHCAPIFDIYGQTPSGLIVGGVSIPSGINLAVIGTWGAYKAALYSFVPWCGDEGHVLITDAWIEANISNPVIDQAKLQAYLASFTQES